MKQKNEEERQRVIKVTDESGDFYRDVDGFFYFWPSEVGKGHYSAHHLRWIADELDRRNAPWQAQIDKYFDEQEANNKPKDEQKMDQ